MDRRQSFMDALNHKTPESVVLDLCGCPLSGLSAEAEDALCKYLGLSGPERREAMLEVLDIDTRGVGDIVCPKRSLYQRLSPTAYIDEWGIERHYTGLYWDIVNAPLANATVEDLENYTWPDPESLDEEQLDRWALQAKHFYEHSDYVVCASHPVYGIFELGCWMCGFEEFMVRMIEDEPFVMRFFQIILDYQKAVIRQYYPRLAPYIHYTSSGDDFATQTNLFISPDMFSRLVAPYFKERITFTKRFTKAKYLHHSCGCVASLIPQMLDCGVEILNPIQPVGPSMSPQTLKAAFGRQIIFHGGLDTQSVLPGGTRESVRAAVSQLLNTMQPDGGYIFAAAHNLQGDVPPENIVTMFQAARTWRA